MLISILGFDPFGLASIPFAGPRPVRKAPEAHADLVEDEDPIQALAYDAERWPHFMDLERN